MDPKNWNKIGIGLLVLFVACAITSAIVGFWSLPGQLISYVGYLALIVLIVLAVLGHRIQNRLVPKKVKYTPPPKPVMTASGGVQMATGQVVAQ